MERAIVSFELDEAGDWVALLECGHRQHVRHRPPWQERPWVLTPKGRAERVGAGLQCRLCDEAIGAEGGDPACLVHLVCPQCGAVVKGHRGHRAGCGAGV
jgi:Protein of unknown function (DUF3565)